MQGVFMENPDKRRGYGIGEMSRRTGVNIETIRYYERIGLLLSPDRTAGGNRQYNHDALKRLSFIRRSRNIGMTLAEIRSLLAMTEGNDFTCAEVHDLTITHLHSIRMKIATLQRLEQTLSDMAAECSRGAVPDCPVIDTLFAL